MNHARSGGVALILFAIAGIGWVALELTPPRLGFSDTDDPAVSLDFLRDHGIVYAYAGLTLFTMAVSLLIGVLVASARRMRPKPRSRSTLAPTPASAEEDHLRAVLGGRPGRIRGGDR